MISKQQLSKAIARLEQHQTLADCHKQLQQMLALSYFNQFIYYAVPVNTLFIDNKLTYLSTGLDAWMTEYLSSGYQHSDPLLQALMATNAPLKFSLENKKISYEALTNILSKNQKILNCLCNDKSMANCLQLHTATAHTAICRYTASQSVLEHCIANGLSHGIVLTLDNYRSMRGVLYLGYQGSTDKFASEYTHKQWQPLERFIYS